MIKEKKVLIDNLNVNYKIEGEGFPFLILHGWGGSSNSWSEVQKILSKNGFIVIVLDLPGFGKTPSPVEPWEIKDYTDFLLKLIDKLNIRQMVLLGHSFGGRISIRFASLYPERLKYLILCASAGVKLPYNFSQFIIYSFSKFGNFLLSPKFLRRFKDWIRNNFYMIIRQRDYRKVKGSMKETFKKIVADDLTADLFKIKTKTLILWGENDKSVPIKAAYIIKEKISDSVLEIIPRASHTPHLEFPEKLSEIILKYLEAEK
jgi:pimeloyl-ACP methyl ester carboxylesterase